MTFLDPTHELMLPSIIMNVCLLNNLIIFDIIWLILINYIWFIQLYSTIFNYIQLNEGCETRLDNQC